MPRLVRLAAAAPLLLALAGCAPGSADDGGAARTIRVTMHDDLSFEPEEIVVAAGESVRFEVENAGAIVHEFLVGDAAAQAEFAEEMAEGHGGHGTDAGVSVPPGETASFNYLVPDGGGGLLAGCHEPGHYEGGMVATIRVEP